MKLLSCHIENFGKLHDLSFEFTEGVNNICQNNGWGKSTFAAFVRAMFYGLEGEKKRSVTENERKRFRPWQGGVFGGNLAFEAHGKRYFLTRTFGEKDQQDTFELRDLNTNLESQDYSAKIGEELFHINSASFMRTMYIGQNDCEAGLTDDINAKIGNLVDDSNDINNFERANERLDAIVKLLNNRSSGSIKLRESEITENERLVKNGATIEQSLDEVQGKLEIETSKLNSIKQDIEDVAKKQAEISKLETVRARKEEWIRLKDNCAQKKTILEEKKAYFPGDIPNMGQLDALENLRSEVELSTAQLQASELSEEEKKTLETSANFVDGTQEEQVSLLQSKWSNRNIKANGLQAKRVAHKSLLSMEKADKKKTFSGPLELIGLLFIGVCGLPFLLFIPVIGIAAIIMGGFMVLVSRLTQKKDLHAVRDPEIDALETEISSDEEYIQTTDLEVSNFLARYGKAFDASTVDRELQNIVNDIRAYGQLASRQEKTDVILSSIEEKKQKLWDGFAALDFEPSMDVKQQLGDVKEALRAYQVSRQSYEEASSQLKAFESKNDVSLLEKHVDEADQTTLNALAAQFTELREKQDACQAVISQYNKQIEVLQEQYDEWESAKEKLVQLKEDQEAEKKKLALVNSAKEYMKQAKENMTARYAAPIKNSFASYFDTINQDGASKFHIDANISVTYDELGKQREIATLSSGYQDLVGVALRMALVDAMYEDEQPTLIMDDPFANLDDDKIKLARKLLDEVGKSRQIVYFTCSNGRM